MRPKFESLALVLAGLGVAAAAASAPLHAQRPAARRVAPAAAPAQSAPIANVRYEVTFDSATARERQIRLAMSFDVTGPGEVLLSLPSWTPGAYDQTVFARNVLDFGATAAAGAGAPLRELDWDKTDWDTWRVAPAGAKRVTVRYAYVADSLDNAMAWSRPDFVFFNGTNVFLFPEGRGLDFPATVAVRTERDWRVRTGMTRAAGAGAASPQGGAETFAERSFHDLVDMPFFVGRFDVDSARVEGIWHWLATYPAGSFQGQHRAKIWSDIRAMMKPMIDVFGEQPFGGYTTMMVFQPETGSALEHQNSHLGIYDPQFMGTPILASITAHEIFHAWNVKRLRPADLWPYDYTRRQPTPLLWVSEGITDYYADLALVRGGIVDSAAFLSLTNQKIQQVQGSRPVALEDASLSTWISPQDGTAYLYYPKGSLAGFMLDIAIRDASDNRHGLDDVLRELYRAAYKNGRGFTTEEFYAVASRLAGGRSFADWHEKYVDGREPYPWAEILPLAGLQASAIPRLGVQTQPDSLGVRVAGVARGSVAEAAGVQAGDYLVSVGDVPVQGINWNLQFRQKFAAAKDGAPMPIVVRREGRTTTLNGTYNTAGAAVQIGFAPSPSAKAVRIRTAIMRGSEK
jgi:predicted metalloprotease with PDZ domain